jgi:hypothetical protein
MSPCRLKHDEGAINVGPKIGVGLLDRWYDVSKRSKVEDSVYPCTGRRDGTCVGNIRLDNLQERVTIMLAQIFPPAADKAIEHANASAARDELIN